MPASQAPSPSRPSPQRHRWLRKLLADCFIVLLTLCAILGVAWWWSGQADSLHKTLERVAQWLPTDQKLEARGVQGTLRHGGQIDWLRWSSPTMQVEVKTVQIDWSLPALLSRTVHFGRVQMNALRIQSPPGTQKEAPTQPLQSLQLPVRINLPVQVENFVWEGTPNIAITALKAHYRYTGQQHELDISSLNYAEGVYEANVRLQASAPMRIQATVQGKLETTLPQHPETTLQIHANASVQGTLATEAARLHIEAKAHSPAITTDAKPAEDKQLSANISAVIAPWGPQILEQADVQLQHINTAWFLPEGPHTDLNGSLQAGPQAGGWQLQTKIQNLLPGAWDQQALPLREINAAAHFDGKQQWTLEHARIDLGNAGDAHIQAQGSFNTEDQVFEGQADLVSINPAALYSTLDASPISGRLQAQSNAERQVAFQLDIHSQPSRKTGSWHLGAARAEGTWQAPLLEVKNIYLEALQASIKSKVFTLNTESQHVEGVVQAQLPGARLELNLQTSPDEGKGRLQLQVESAQTLAEWINHLPGLQDPFKGSELKGSMQANLQWQGGWHKLQQRLQNPAAAVQPSGLRINAQLQTPKLSYTAAEGASSHISDFKLLLSGTPEALRVDLDTHAQVGVYSISLQTDATAGLATHPQSYALDWQTTITRLAAQWHAPGDDSPWKAQLAAPATIRQMTTGNPVQVTQIKANEGHITITPPRNAGEHTANIRWEPLTMRHDGRGSWGIQSKGRLQNLPLMWIDTLNRNHPPLAGLGISGDLIFQGEWDVDNTSRNMRAHAILERASGDIRFTAEDGNSANVTIIRSTGASARSTTTNQIESRAFSSNRGVRARIQTMRLELDAQGEALRTQLEWVTERAGQIKVDVHSQFSQTPDGIVWPNNAPIRGSVQAALPNIGVWAFFAPPGWRTTGSFNANLALSGTRKAPNWSGEIKADELSLQSLLDGIDLKNGHLRAQLRGTRLDITELLLHGGEGNSTRIVGQSGNLTSAPKSGGTLTGSGFIEYDPMAPASNSGLRMDLRATANQLQVLVRADRQLSISGQLQAGLNQGQFKLGGDLTIDRAAIILSDDSAPSLGADVYITSAATRKAALEKKEKEASQAGSIQATKPPELNVRINLGNDFALQGYGITTRLGGTITVTQGPRITGEIHTINGRYRAWGQVLDVEQGTIRFNGPYANPAIDIVAIRPNIDLRAGVKVTGSVNNPRVTLFSDPDMSDAEKLSWIIMGRGASGGGAEAALLQQAALALLSGGGSTGNFASQLGFDEISFKGPSDDGEQAAALTVGKRLSKDLYVTYEQSLNGAMGILYIFYDLSRRLTLRAQTGEQSAVDLIYTKVSD